MTTTAIHLTNLRHRPARAATHANRIFRFARGVDIAYPAGIREGYEMVEKKSGRWTFTINVSAEHIRQTFISLVRRIRNPGYFVLEIGTPVQEEAELRKTRAAPHYRDVYFLDGTSRGRAVTLFDGYEDLFVHDGRTQVGFGTHDGLDEVYIGSYKVFQIFTRVPKKYVSVLRRLNIPRQTSLRTVWQTFTPTTPGRREPLHDSPEVIGRMLAYLNARGLYFAERREDSR